MNESGALLSRRTARPLRPRRPPAGDIPALQTKLRRKIIEFRNLFEITRVLNLALDLDEVLNLLGLV